MDDAQRPSEREMRDNSRSRSAILHVLRKVDAGRRLADVERAAYPLLGWAPPPDAPKPPPVTFKYEAANADKSPGERFKFAEPAKKAVKAYISYDGGNGSAAGTETYADISEALRELSAFYKRNGATTAVSDEVREKILSRLYEARDLLPPPEPTIMDKLLNLKKDE